MTITIELPEDAEGRVQARRAELRAAKHRRADAGTRTALRAWRQMMGLPEPRDR